MTAPFFFDYDDYVPLFFSFNFTSSVMFELGGSIPRFVSDTLTTPAAANAPLAAQMYLIQTKETAALDADGVDARALGQLLLHEMEPVRTKSRTDELKFKLNTFVYRTTVLRELTDKHPWFPCMLLHLLQNKPRIMSFNLEKREQGKNQLSIKKKSLSEFMEKDVTTTGGAMALILLSNATPDAAVDEWILTFPALCELESSNPFLRPFTNVIVKHLITVASFGLKARLFSGAALSHFDLASDIYISTVYLRSNETKSAAHAIIVCIAISLFFQLYAVWIANKKRSWRNIALEALYVLTFIKPGVDAARVAAGNEYIDDLATMEPLMELACGKVFEMAFESIPGAIIQTCALIASKEVRNTAALVCILSSCCTTGFAAASIW